MDWPEAVRARAKRKNKVLFMPGDSLFDALAPLTERAGRRALVLWALSLAEETLPRLQALLPGDARPSRAVALSRQWARGEVKMPAAKAAILACHAAGQACAVVHAHGHALGFAVYELTAIARREGVEDCRARVEARVCEYVSRLLRAEEEAANAAGPWAGFLEA